MLGRGFSARCKSLLKVTRTRIGVIWRKRNAVEKFLKEDIADLLANGLDVNAYGRAEGLLVELTVSSCYVYIELCCLFLSTQLSSLQKTSDCPENCRESLSSLMFAAARFSDLPELRELRQVLKRRYGNSLDHFVNREFAERMKAKPSAMERKIEIMQGIALEFSIYWDSKAFEQRMSMSPSILQDRLKCYRASPHSNHKAEIFGNKATLWQRFVEADDNNLPSNEESSGFIGRYKGNPDHHPKAELSRNWHDVSNGESLGIVAEIERGKAKPKEFLILAYDGIWGEVNPFQMGRSGCSYCGRRHEGKVGRSNRRTRRKNYHSKRDSTCDTSPCRKEAAEMPRYQNEVNPSCIQLDSKSPKEGDYKEENGHPEILHEGRNSDSVIDELEVALHHPIDAEKDVKSVKTTLHGHHEEPVRQDDAGGHFLPGPKSVRSRPSKLCPIFDDSSHEVAYLGKRTSRSSPRSEEAKKGLRVTFQDECSQCDEEERIIDRLLMHYSKKPSVYEPGRLRRKHGSHHGDQIDQLKHEEEDPIVRPPLRSISLPLEHTTAAEMPAKAMIRAASLPPGSSSRARHVHPKLPEYDDLVARLASLRGT